MEVAMSSRTMWCAACNAVVEVAVTESVSAVVAPLLGAATGGAIGHARGGKNGVVAGALTGLIVGAIAHAATAEAQRLVCGRCSRPLSGHGPSWG